jgi:hypothetical protein
MHSFPFLPYITFIRLRITFEAVEIVSFYNEKGTAFRSCFMEAMMKVACVKSYKKCDLTCSQIYTCGYSLLINSLSSVDHPHHGNFKNTPPPYIIEPIQDSKTTFKSRESFGFELTLIGSGIDRLQMVLKAIPLMEDNGIGKEIEKGKGRGKFQLLLIEGLSSDLTYKPLSYGAKKIDVISISNLKIPIANNELIIQHDIKFRTTEDKKHLSDAPTFQLFAKRLVERLSQLANFHCNAPWYDTKDLKMPSDIQIFKDSIQEEFSERKTCTMDSMMKIDGIVGQVVYKGEGLNNWLPLIVMGSYLHVGSTTSMGLGKYSILTD